MSTESDLKQMEESQGYVPPKSAAQKPKSNPAKATPVPVVPAKTNLLSTAKGHLPALPIALGLIFLGLGTAMVLYKVAR